MTATEAAKILDAEEVIRTSLIPRLEGRATQHAVSALNGEWTDRQLFEKACRGKENRAVVEFLSNLINDAGALLDRKTT